MWRIIPALFVLGGLATAAHAQQPQPEWRWPGPWFMDWSSFWWICPLMMVGMMLVMMFACRFMGCGWHRD